MAIYTTTFDVPGDLEAIFEYLADFSNAASWDPGVPRATKLDDGPPKLGTRFDVAVSFLGTTSTLRYEITRHDPPHVLEFEARTGLMTSRDEISLVSTPKGVHVTYIARLELHGLLFAADPPLQFLFDRIASRARDGLVQALERISPRLAESA